MNPRGPPAPQLLHRLHLPPAGPPGAEGTAPRGRARAPGAPLGGGGEDVPRGRARRCQRGSAPRDRAARPGAAGRSGAPPAPPRAPPQPPPAERGREGGREGGRRGVCKVGETAPPAGLQRFQIFFFLFNFFFFFLVRTARGGARSGLPPPLPFPPAAPPARSLYRGSVCTAVLARGIAAALPIRQGLSNHLPLPPSPLLSLYFIFTCSLLTRLFLNTAWIYFFLFFFL